MRILQILGKYSTTVAYQKTQADFTNDASLELAFSVINRPKVILLVFTYLYLGELFAIARFFWKCCHCKKLGAVDLLIRHLVN